MWEHKHVPQSWQNRTLVTVKKTLSSTQLTEMRPIMLLELLRKEFLSLIYDRIDKLLRTNGMFHPSQKGGLARTSTEDAILAIKNAIESAWQEGTPLYLLAFDKTKAFDSPARLFAALAWERLGLPRAVARYLIDVDITNKVTPKTVHSILHPDDAESFHAISGCPQGDSISCRSYIALEDIILHFLDTQASLMDLFTYKHPQGHFTQQKPTQYVDDTHIMCGTRDGAQHAVHAMRMAGPILNIRINPVKTRFAALCFGEDHRVLDTKDVFLTTTNNDGDEVIIQAAETDESIRFLGAWLNMNDNDDTTIQHCLDIIKRTLAVLASKRATGNTLITGIHSSLLPAIGYVTKFTNSSYA
jgi:hypothetical protein